jgi:hypothetical protein
MVGDDLDAFFDDVAEAEVKAVDEEPPLKKQKFEAVRPQGVIVAAASSAGATQSKSSAQTDSELATKEGTSNPDGPISSKSLAMSIGPLGSAGRNAPQILPPQRSALLPPPPPPPPLPKKPHVRSAAGKTWIDSSLDDWPQNDFRIFVGNMGNDVTDQQLYDHFVSKYPSLLRTKVVRDAKTSESKGYGFVSLGDALECAKAIREMDQTWLGSRPIRLKRSNWKDREASKRIYKTRR